MGVCASVDVLFFAVIVLGSNRPATLQVAFVFVKQHLGWCYHTHAHTSEGVMSVTCCYLHNRKGRLQGRTSDMTRVSVQDLSAWWTARGYTVPVKDHRHEGATPFRTSPADELEAVLQDCDSLGSGTAEPSIYHADSDDKETGSTNCSPTCAQDVYNAACTHILLGMLAASDTTTACVGHTPNGTIGGKKVVAPAQVAMHGLPEKHAKDHCLHVQAAAAAATIGIRASPGVPHPSHVTDFKQHQYWITAYSEPKKLRTSQQPSGSLISQSQCALCNPVCSLKAGLTTGVTVIRCQIALNRNMDAEMAKGCGALANAHGTFVRLLQVVLAVLGDTVVKEAPVA